MVGAALSKMWATNPKLACFFQTLLCLMLAVFMAGILLGGSRNWTVIIIVGIGFVIETSTLVGFTYDAVKDGWAPSDY